MDALPELRTKMGCAKAKLALKNNKKANIKFTEKDSGKNNN
jgi:hypothetical protein